MEYLLTTSPAPGMILWIILYVSDYYLTLYSARGFREIGHFQFEGSFELTPQYQKDIDALNTVSKRHILWLTVSSLLILFLWWFTKRLLFFPWTYLLFLGMFLLLEAAVHLRHLRNISLIREIRKGGGVEGEIRYRKWFSYRISASELYRYSTLFLLIAALTYSPLCLGGALTCFATGIKHSRLARQAKLTAQIALPGRDTV